MKVPKSDVVIESACCHSMTFGLNYAAGDCFVVPFESGECVDRYAKLMPVLIAFLSVWLDLNLQFLF
jgi:hypothetical protein